jgi:hypothetical protein
MSKSDKIVTEKANTRFTRKASVITILPPFRFITSNPKINKYENNAVEPILTAKRKGSILLIPKSILKNNFGQTPMNNIANTTAMNTIRPSLSHLS